MERTVDGQSGQDQRDPVAVRSCPVESISLELLAELETPTIAWIDDQTTLLASGQTVSISANGADRFVTVRNQAQRLFARFEQSESNFEDARPRVIGGFSFTDTHRDPPPRSTWEGFPGAWFVLPEVQFTATSSGAWVTTTAVGSNAETRAKDRLERYQELSVPERNSTNVPSVTRKTYAPERSDWQRQIEEATAKIGAGTLRKVVLAQALTAELSGPIATHEILSELGRSYPACIRFGFEPLTGGAFFGATPERLVTLEGKHVKTAGLAGSIGRGETQNEDEWLAEQLLTSEKNIHEHEIVVDTICEQLTPVTESVRTGERGIRKLANVQHLQTPVSATLSESRHVLDLVEALHPTPAVGGLPPEVALQTIHDTEVFDRGWYAAPVGWFDANGDGTFGVAIRSAIARNDEATLFAGAGIVGDSDPDEEYDELQLKYKPILDELA